MPTVSAGFDAPLFEGSYFRNLQKQISGSVNAGLPAQVILMAMDAGMHPQDVAFLSRYSHGAGYLIVIRCPSQAAFAHHGALRPKPQAWKEKSGPDGIARRGDLERVSDYDLMCFYERVGGAFHKIVMTATTWDGTKTGAGRGAYTGKATLVLREMNKLLHSRFQHGCQDDWANEANRGVKPHDRFIAFKCGQVIYLESPQACGNFYVQHGLEWLYDKRLSKTRDNEDVYRYIGPIGEKGHAQGA